jgi:hypothetical protein
LLPLCQTAYQLRSTHRGDKENRHESKAKIQF